MKEYIFLCAGSFLVLLSSCGTSANINSLCEKDKQGNYIVKWEITPDPEKGHLEIYTSTNDDSFKNNKSLLLVTNVENRVATFQPKDKNVREYFQLKANDSYSGIITNRQLNFDIIQNFRDLGGYYDDENKQLKWGNIFRSGNLFRITPHDENKLKRLGIRTVIDLRTEKENKIYTDDFLGYTHYNLSIDTLSSFEVEEKIASRQFHRNDALTYMQDAYRSIIERDTPQLKEIFNLLLDKKNYPVLIHDNLGKDRTGVVSYLILLALGVNSDDAINDYLLSNDYIDLDNYSTIMSQMPESMQEATTVAIKADDDYFDSALDYINNKYGNIDNYFTKALNLTPEKRKQLKTIMTY